MITPRTAANDTAPINTTGATHSDLVHIRQEIRAAAFAATSRGKRALAARR